MSAVGEVLGEYLVKRLVGEGGMGRVYEAEERLSGRRVALKVLRSELTRNDEGRRLFLNEMRILAHLEHPGIVRSLASMEVDGQLVMALEFLDGRTLRAELTERGPLAWQEAVDLTVRIADALAAAHAQEPPIVHRDLKPENVMRTVSAPTGPKGSTYGLKVMDFGIAKVLEGAHGTNTQSIGTLQYMSPEQIDARGVDGRTDLYALGLLLYEMLAGSPPFHSPSPRELLNLQCTQPPPPLPERAREGLPRGVEDLMLQLLEKEPDRRPASAREVVDRLTPFRPAQLTGPSPVAAAPSTPTASPAVVPAPTPAPTPTPATEPSPKTDTHISAGGPARPTPSRSKGGPGDIPVPLALAVIVVLSLLAGLSTYVVRVGLNARGPEPMATASGRQILSPPGP